MNPPLFPQVAFPRPHSPCAGGTLEHSSRSLVCVRERNKPVTPQIVKITIGEPGVMQKCRSGSCLGDAAGNCGGDGACGGLEGWVK